jgi:RNA polymerase sigma-70 factor (ECF subfamily)
MGQVLAIADVGGVSASESDDAELLRRVSAEDAVAFRVLVQRYQDRIFGFCLRMLGDPSEAEDIAQDVFVTVYKHAGTFRGDSQVSTWLYRIAKNHTLNRIKYLDRRGRQQRTSLHQLRDEPEDAGRRPDQLQEDRETWRLLQEALGQLDEDFRSVVVFRDLEGLSYEEIGEITGLPSGTVKSRIHRGRAALAAELERLMS